MNLFNRLKKILSGTNHTKIEPKKTSELEDRIHQLEQQLATKQKE